MNINKKLTERSEEEYDELIEYLSNSPYELDSAIDDEKLIEIAGDVAESELDDYADAKYEQMKDERYEDRD